MRRRGAMAAVAVLALTLTGCTFIGPLFGVNDGYRATHRWLDEQKIVQTVVETNPYYQDTELQGELHAELDPDATLDQVEAFGRDAVEFLDSQDSYAVYLSAGRAGVDFAIRDDAGVESALPIWDELDTGHVPGLDALMVDPGAYHDGPEDGVRILGRVLIDDAGSVLDGLRARVPGTALSIRAYTDADQLAERNDNGAWLANGNLGVGVGQLLSAADCTPTADVQAVAIDTIRAGAAGDLDLCEGWQLDYDGAPIGLTAIELRATLDARGIDLPVTMESRTSIPNAQVRTVVVTPGSADALEILRDLDADGALHELAGYTLDESRALSIGAYRQPTQQLVDLVTSSPASAALTSAELRGETYAVAGSVSDLPAVSDAVAGFAGPALDYVDVAADSAKVFFIDEPSESDVREVARGLRSSGLADTREFTVDIDDDVLLITDGTIHGGGSGPLARFSDEWSK